MSVGNKYDPWCVKVDAARVRRHPAPLLGTPPRYPDPLLSSPTLSLVFHFVPPRLPCPASFYYVRYFHTLLTRVPLEAFPDSSLPFAAPTRLTPSFPASFFILCPLTSGSQTLLRDVSLVDVTLTQ